MELRLPGERPGSKTQKGERPMKIYVAVTAIALLSLISLAIASIPFEGHRMEKDRAVAKQVQMETTGGAFAL
jgi:hypothetical protein